MKNLLCCLFCLLVASQVFAQKSASKYALLVGVNRYPAASGWREIHGRDDVDSLHRSLERRGFIVRTLCDSEATKKNIRDSMAKLAADLKPGDLVLLLFSLHGQQIADQPDRRDEPDGWDEALIPFDCPMYEGDAPPDYDGQLHYLDDELNEDLAALRQAVGNRGDGQVFLLSDACFAGDGARSMSAGDARPRRGGARAFVPDFSKKMGDSQFSPSRDVSQFSDFGEAAEKKLAPLVAFFACAPGQKNYEIRDSDQQKYLGSLSTAFRQTLENERFISYQVLFEQICRRIQVLVPGQSPQFEGNLARRFLGGRITSKSDHLLIVKYIDDEHYRLDQGWAGGVFKGTQVLIFDADTWDTTAQSGRVLLAKGFVNDCNFMSAKIKLDRKVPDSSLIGKWAFIAERRKDDSPLDYQNFVRSLKTIAAPDSRGDFDELKITVQPFRCDGDGNFQSNFEEKRSDTLVLAPGDCLRFCLKNEKKSAAEVYFNILDFPPAERDTAFVLVPISEERHRPHSVKGNGGEWCSPETADKETKQYPFAIEDLPDGLGEAVEVFKVVVSDVPFNLWNDLPTRSWGQKIFENTPVVQDRHLATFDIPVIVRRKK